MSDEKDYKKLIEQVRLIDEKAAKYLEGLARSLPGFKPNGDLPMCFIYKDSLQGADYWLNIKKSIDKLEGVKSEPTKICKQCKVSKPLTVKFFTLMPTCKDGFDTLCRRCRLDKAKDRYQKQKKILKNLDSDNNLDLTDLLLNKHLAIYEKLKKQAEENFRSMKYEILYLIKTGLI